VSPEEAEFVDRLGLFMERLGATRTMGRVYGWLLICDPPRQSLTERLPSPTRQHHYRVTPGGFSSVLDTQLSLMKPGIDVADFGLSLLGKDRAEQRERLEDFRDFCQFSTQDYRDELMQRWNHYRANRRNG